MKTTEEQLIEQYFDAFNRHNIDDVMACFHPDAIVGDSDTRAEGHDAVRLHYERQFAAIHDERGVAESLFHGTTRDGRPIRALGAEVIEFADGKIREIRDYHRVIDESEVTSSA